MSSSDSSTFSFTSLPEVQFLSQAWAFIASVHVELMLFFLSLIAYFVLFGNILPQQRLRASHLKAKVAKESDEGLNFNQAEYDRTVTGFVTAYDAGDCRTALKFWNLLKKFKQLPPVQVAQVVECMRRSRKETPQIISELQATFKQYGDEYDMVMV
eukprot:CAMPEP_0194484554 /NCGR_PEP_ID=MMETSP0253-20130528/5851_1 /TAXON_ID=2966 /ORGANISM="Noctiluca scintillans" /LENGTH=155 /DNA_ID=CAMNT_0039324385 /DNA_START=89 /DNA_END=553 /DNA_ORIENTATION=+